MIDRQDRGLNKKTVEYYTEKHHIIPKSLGGTNDSENLVLLTGREHYVAHWLLTKFTGNTTKQKMVFAFWLMALTNKDNNKNLSREKITSRQFQRARVLHSVERLTYKNNRPYVRKKPYSAEEQEMRKEAGRRLAKLRAENEQVSKMAQEKSLKTRKDKIEAGAYELHFSADSLNRLEQARKISARTSRRTRGTKTTYNNNVSFYCFRDALWYCNTYLNEKIKTKSMIKVRCEDKNNLFWEFVK